MIIKQKETIHINDPKTLKVLNAPFTKRILECFNDEPKTAGQIANSISFPKEKIYYHIKKLISKDILFITSTDLVKGIEQKLFLPSAKRFITSKNIKKQKEPEKNKLQIKNKSEPFKESPTKQIKRKINERRRKNTRRSTDRRLSIRRIQKITVSGQNNKRQLGDRRVNDDQRKIHIRRELLDRRFETSQKINNHKKITQKSISKIRSIKVKNLLLKLNGIKNAMTFVETGNCVTFLFCKLNYNGFQIERINNYVLPIKVKGHEINNLIELIINVSNQFNQAKEKKKVYLAIHSDKYHCEMTYVLAKGKNKKLFKKDLIKTLNNSYDLNNNSSIFDFISYQNHIKNAAVCISNKKPQINKDYIKLKDAGLQPRYNTSIPQILNNIYTYYNLDQNNQYSLLIYIDREKTHVVFSKKEQLFESKEINKGLNYFTNALSELSLVNLSLEEAIDNALHFLSRYGLGVKTSENTIQSGIPFKKAKSIIDHITNVFIEEIKESIYYFEKILLHDGYSEKVISQLYICGVGSHIKDFDKVIAEKLRINVKNLSDYNSAYIQETKNSQGPILDRIKTNNLFKKKENRESDLDLVKKRITEHEKAIESVQSPESAKYRLTRLEMEKNSKIKVIESANRKLIDASKEFKQIKNEYMTDQENLKSNLDSVTDLLDEQSSILVEKYREHEEIIKTISELEFETDHSKNDRNTENQKKKGIYQSRVKDAAHSRAKLGDDKENIENKIDDLESTILKLEETLYQINQKIENGNDEISVFEYLKDSIQATANSFKHSFLDHMQSLENLTEKDLNTLQQSGYLLTQNTKRLDEIKQSFSALVSGDSNIDPEFIMDGNTGVEIREKLLNILYLVVEAPDNLIHLKNLTGSIIKINESQSELLDKRNLNHNQTKQAKKSIRANQKNLTSLNNEINVNTKEMDRRVKDRSEQLELLQHTREIIEMIHDLEHHTLLLKELKPQRKSHKDDIKDIANRMIRLNSLIETCGNTYEQLELQQAELAQIFDKDNKMLIKKADILSAEEDTIKTQIDTNKKMRESNVEDMSNASVYMDQLEKQVVSKKEEIEKLNEEKSPLVETLLSDRENIIKEYDTKIMTINNEEEQKRIEAKKTKSETIETYFKKEMITLEKNNLMFERTLIKAKKEKDKSKSEAEKIKSTLTQMKKKNMPIISNLNKQIKGWEKDLSQGRRFQDRLDKLEHKKREWEDLLINEKRNINSQIDNLKSTIERKRSSSYLLFLQNGLNRFQNQGDLEETSKNMAEDSILMDKEEIKKLTQDLEKITGRYEAFMASYRKSHRDVLGKLRPYGGRKKIILGKIKKGKDKVQILESKIRTLVQKLDEKNEIIIEKQKIFNDISDNVKTNQAEIKDEIQNIPNKKTRAKSDVDKKLKERLLQISQKRENLNNKKIQELSSLDIAFQKEDLIVGINKAEEKMIFFFNEIEKTKGKVKFYLKEEEKFSKTELLLKNKLKKIFKKHHQSQIAIAEKDQKFKDENSELNKSMKSNRGEFSILQEQLLALDQQKDDIMKKLKKVDDEYSTSNDKINDLDKKIKIPKNIPHLESGLNNNRKRKNRKEQLRFLTQIEKDMMVGIERLERMIKDLNILIDSMHNEQSGITSTLSLLKNDLEYYDSDLSRIQTLIDNNNEHLLKISSDHNKSLNVISNIKDLYPSCKIMLNERITNLYTLMELTVKDRDTLISELDELKEKLKNRRVEAAIIDRELGKINEKMKDALESSFYEKENTDSGWKWEIAKNKMNSYMDLAQLKAQSKELFNLIADTEQEIAKLKNQQSSINNVISEKEKISHKKIKGMEEICTRLELQITKEKNQLEGLEQEVQQLTGMAYNYGDRIDVLEQELKDFREKQTEYEFELKDLERSLDSIQNISDKIIKRERSIKDSSIHLDYTANLGLLMNPNLHLNLLPNYYKKEFKYFRPNQILQNAILVLITVFSLGAYTQRSRIVPIENILPVKQSELQLLNMRQEMKQIINQKNAIASSFTKLIQNDSRASSEIIEVLKYLSQNIPINCQITNLEIEKDELESITQDNLSWSNDVTLKVNGFYEKDLQKFSQNINRLQEMFMNSGKFKNVTIEKNTNPKKNRKDFTITIIR